MSKQSDQPEPNQLLSLEMLRIARSAARTSNISKRYAHHGVHYGPAEPLSYYLKWIAVVGSFTGLLAYDRFYTDRAISKLVTPETDTAAIERQRQQFADRQVQEQDRNVELLFPRKRSAYEVYNARPVPEAAHRAVYSNNVVDADTVGERRPRTQPHSDI